MRALFDSENPRMPEGTVVFFGSKVDPTKGEEIIEHAMWLAVLYVDTLTNRKIP
ncbi:hypothetical protein [Nocardia brasiliensis]